ncbi:MAG: S1C family serine protease [Syntrophomonadaceae bacterium]|jgi:serine protease Do
MKNQNEVKHLTKTEPEEWEWELADEELAQAPRKKRWPFRIVALLIILGFAALSFPELKFILSYQLGFLAGNQILSTDEIVKRAKPAVVSIEATVWNGPFMSAHQGTGFNISPQGKIITNHHVVSGSKQIKISFGDGRVFYSDRFTAIKGVDLATIELHSYNLPAIPVDKKADIRGGEQVTIIGNPLGLDKIAQRGRVGQHHRTSENRIPVFDINVPANPGNSGSPVLNERGRVIGVVFASSQIKTNAHNETHALAIPIQALQ